MIDGNIFKFCQGFEVNSPELISTVRRSPPIWKKINIWIDSIIESGLVKFDDKV